MCITTCFERGARLFQEGVETNIGVWHEAGHAEPWIIAMDCPPTPAAVRDYGLRWGIEPMFSDFKSRGFGLEDTQLRDPERVDHPVVVSRGNITDRFNWELDIRPRMV